MLVVHSSARAVLGLELKYVRVDGGFEARFAKTDQGQVIPIVRVLVSEVGWKVRKVHIAPPLHPATSSQSPEQFEAFRMTLPSESHAQPLLKAAAWDAYQGLSVADMTTVVSHFEVPYEGVGRRSRRTSRGCWCRGSCRSSAPARLTRLWTSGSRGAGQCSPRF